MHSFRNSSYLRVSWYSGSRRNTRTKNIQFFSTNISGRNRGDQFAYSIAQCIGCYITVSQSADEDAAILPTDTGAINVFAEDIGKYTETADFLGRFSLPDIFGNERMIGTFGGT